MLAFILSVALIGSIMVFLLITSQLLGFLGSKIDYIEKLII